MSVKFPDKQMITTSNSIDEMIGMSGAINARIDDWKPFESESVKLLKVAKLLPDDILQTLIPFTNLYRLYDTKEDKIMKLATSITKENQVEVIKRLRLML